MTFTLNPSTTVSGVNELLHLREQLDTLIDRHVEVAQHIIEDADFMDGRIIRIQHFEARRLKDLPLGALVHVGQFEWEPHPRLGDYAAHPVDDCPAQQRETHRRRTNWCEQALHEKVRAPYTREPNRSWHTNLGTWMVVGQDHTAETVTLVAIGEAAAREVGE